MSDKTLMSYYLPITSLFIFISSFLSFWERPLSFVERDKNGSIKLIRFYGSEFKIQFLQFTLMRQVPL